MGGRFDAFFAPTLKDRIVQMATKIVIEPIFEANFEPNSYGFRPKRNAHQAIEDIEKNLAYGYTTVIDADLSQYFDTIPHTKLLSLVAKRVVDKNILRLIKQWLKAPIVEELDNGKKKYTNLKSQLTKKYGNPTVSFERVGGKLWDETDEFYQCLAYPGCGDYIAFFKSQSGASVVLELKGLGRGKGYLRISYEGPSWPDAVDAYKSKEAKSDEDAL